MTFFTQRGSLILKDQNGKFHLLEGSLTIKEAANYIWETENLKSYRINDEELNEQYSNIEVPTISTINIPARLRNLEMKSDSYFLDNYDGE